jgi:cytochrome c-type protein NapC
MEQQDETKSKGSLKSRLWKIPGKWYWLGIPAGGYILFVLGVSFLAGFNATMEHSSSDEFCISCHAMGEFVYPEYQQTIHYSNRTGVRATCESCHVPTPWFAKVHRKVEASLHEIPHWLMGTIDTPEKFEARRLFLAKRVWRSMKEDDSRECRNCHELNHMDLDLQARSARSKHTLKRQTERGETCIDCHQGIAHHLPEDWQEEFELLSDPESK